MGNLLLVNTTLAWLRRSSDLTAHFSTTVSFPPVEAHQVVITYLGLFLQTIFTWDVHVLRCLPAAFHLLRMRKDVIVSFSTVVPLHKYFIKLARVLRG